MLSKHLGIEYLQSCSLLHGILQIVIDLFLRKQMEKRKNKSQESSFYPWIGSSMQNIYISRIQNGYFILIFLVYLHSPQPLYRTSTTWHYPLWNSLKVRDFLLSSSILFSSSTLHLFFHPYFISRCPSCVTHTSTDILLVHSTAIDFISFHI